MYPFEGDMALTTLGTDQLLSGTLTNFGTTKVQCISADCYWSYDGLTAGEGPLRVGFNNSDLTDDQCEEALDAAPTSQADIILMERTKRPVREAGRFAGLSTNEVLNDGVAVRTRLGFVLDEGAELDFWVRNEGEAALTTGSRMKVSGKLYMRWI